MTHYMELLATNQPWNLIIFMAIHGLNAPFDYLIYNKIHPDIILMRRSTNDGHCRRDAADGHSRIVLRQRNRKMIA